jgi:hypothetical protein
MQKFYYSIYDRKAKFYSTPFLQVNNEVAIREFHDLVADETLAPFKHPEDYELFLLAMFNDQTGDITHVEHEHLVSGGA